MPKLNEVRKEFAELSRTQVEKRIQEKRLQLFNLRLQQQRGEVKNNRIFAQTKKDIARLLHRLTQLENEA